MTDTSAHAAGTAQQITGAAAGSLVARGLTKTFPLSRNAFGRPTSRLRAVDGVDLDVTAGTTVGVVGESGSGKTTLGRLVSLLERPDSGSIVLDGRDVTRLRGKGLTALRPRLQVVFQDPFGSLDPTKSIAHAVAEPLLVHGRIRRSQMPAAAEELVARVGLDPALARRYPEQLSGGQRQRVCIARALAAKPKLIICDEVTSALDPLVANGILKLLLELQAEEGVAYLFITHDLATVKSIADSIAVMYRGEVVRYGSKSEVLAPPFDAYTDLLLSSVPEMEIGWIDKAIATRRMESAGN